MKYDSLKIENQLCFPLYAASKEIIRKYKPLLDKIDLTYTQYITMMILWDSDSINVKELGSKLYLDSGTLTPLLNKLETKGLVKKKKNKDDERNLVVTLTEKGLKLKDEAIDIPNGIKKCVNLTEEEALFLYKILYKILKEMEDN